VLGRQEQDPCGWIPSGLGQQLLVQRSRQHRGGAVETDTGEHMRELGRLLAAPSCGAGHGGGHRFTAPSSRGLGTASTAARSRVESGCI
jgi:hypothetical protein